MSGFVFRTVGVNEGTNNGTATEKSELNEGTVFILGGSMSGNEETIMGQ